MTASYNLLNYVQKRILSNPENRLLLQLICEYQDRLSQKYLEEKSVYEKNHRYKSKWIRWIFKCPKKPNGVDPDIICYNSSLFKTRERLQALIKAKLITHIVKMSHTSMGSFIDKEWIFVSDDIKERLFSTEEL